MPPKRGQRDGADDDPESPAKQRTTLTDATHMHTLRRPKLPDSRIVGRLPVEEESISSPKEASYQEDISRTSPSNLGKPRHGDRLPDEESPKKTKLVGLSTKEPGGLTMHQAPKIKSPIGLDHITGRKIDRTASTESPAGPDSQSSGKNDSHTANVTQQRPRNVSAVSVKPRRSAQASSFSRTGQGKAEQRTTKAKVKPRDPHEVISHPRDSAIPCQHQPRSGQDTAKSLDISAKSRNGSGTSMSRMQKGPEGDQGASVLMRQPESTPITQEQLAAEVKGIYAGLVVVEKKCIAIDAAQAANPDSKLASEQWQALIALHRTLLYEHHDFFMATQHPSATPALSGLAAKYSMPARMWKHGIHAFLEVLRHRRPESQDYMLAFIYLAYQMMGLLYETVPCFTETWIECLGDLARYRMAIEDEREAHTTWGRMAARWYTTAADRQPSTGRLYHHLGILERPGLYKLFLYSKSLTCVIPFQNARDSLATFIRPIVQDEHSTLHRDRPAEAYFVLFYCKWFSGSSAGSLKSIAEQALTKLRSESSPKIKLFGFSLVCTTIASMMELGAQGNDLWRMFNDVVHNPENTSNLNSIRRSADADIHKIRDTSNSTPATPFLTNFAYDIFNTLLTHTGDQHVVCDLLPAVHAMLAWVYSLLTLERRLEVVDGIHTLDPLEDLRKLSWVGLAHFLNALCRYQVVNAPTIEYARKGTFVFSDDQTQNRPLAEDFALRGLSWTQNYLPKDLFSSQALGEEREIETSIMVSGRVARVQWLGLYLAFHTDRLRFDVNSSVFSASAFDSKSSEISSNENVAHISKASTLEVLGPSTRSPTTWSGNSDSDGNVIVGKRKSDQPAFAKRKKTSPTTWADVLATKRIDTSTDGQHIRIVNTEDDYLPTSTKKSRARFYCGGKEEVQHWCGPSNAQVARR